MEWYSPSLAERAIISTSTRPWLQIWLESNIAQTTLAKVSFLPGNTLFCNHSFKPWCSRHYGDCCELFPGVWMNHDLLVMLIESLLNNSWNLNSLNSRTVADWVSPWVLIENCFNNSAPIACCAPTPRLEDKWKLAIDNWLKSRPNFDNWLAHRYALFLCSLDVEI